MDSDLLDGDQAAVELAVEIISEIRTYRNEVNYVRGGARWTAQDFADYMEGKLGSLHKLRAAGQKEYAHNDSTPFRNFERLSEKLGVPREIVAFVFLQKHLDGILAHIRGHVSQREPVQGRVDDSGVYNLLLGAMLAEREVGTVLP